MSYNNRLPLINELKELFGRYRSKVYGSFNPEERNFTKNLIRELNLGSRILPLNMKSNSRILIIELNSVFHQLQNLPITMKDPEDPNFTDFLLHFIKHSDIYKSAASLFKENLLEFKRILNILHSDLLVWENNPEKEDFIWDLFFIINSPEIVCSACGGKIHNKDLKNKVLGLRKIVKKSNYNFSIVVPIYCCKCYSLVT